MVVDPRMSPSVQDLKCAIGKGLIEPAFQPLVDIGAEVTIGFEVLARWQHPTLGAVSPAVFIKLAEDNALINALTAQVIEKACKRLAELGSGPILAFNLSPVQFRDEAIVALVVGAIAAHGISSCRIISN